MLLADPYDRVAEKKCLLPPWVITSAGLGMIVFIKMFVIVAAAGWLLGSTPHPVSDMLHLATVINLAIITSNYL